ncbi:hypothetical protein HMPREF0063_11069 [Aeromicrobium marinum DSM 15272]|uniref:DUF1990 domain-containing protein n=1 Tax=Aeromicrobium marinum DSM 15272 TaxID=585531 RepID=E2SAL1_9ACTN|nr:DUF1990 domain-containing protein [Aeromicrobium marinum]EFQ83407.1 hypothetical protein HMPREF0063_11069 [Aeromicrobium marinum DSM 15272]
MRPQAQPGPVAGAGLPRRRDAGRALTGLTYAEVGATARSPLPAGYHHVRAHRDLGAVDLDAVAEVLLTWQMHERAGVRRVRGAERVAHGAEVTFRFLGQTIPCRVVAVVDEPDRRGFAYGTLPGHPECGEERFLLERDPATGHVSAVITAFSRPGTWRTRIIGPLGRALQRHMTRRYLAALTR